MRRFKVRSVERPMWAAVVRRNREAEGGRKEIKMPKRRLNIRLVYYVHKTVYITNVQKWWEERHVVPPQI